MVLKWVNLVSNGKIRSSWSWNEPIGTACYKQVKWSWNESIWYQMVKLGHLGLEMSQLVQHAISRSNGLEMSQFGIQR